MQLQEGAVDLNILMYHSVSDSAGPTSIPLEVFRAQIEALAESGYQAISMAGFKAWHAHKQDLPARSVLITFDDGFADFADSAFPVLKAHDFTATVFLPSGRIGTTEQWKGADRRAPRRLMNWAQVVELARENIDFGGHGVTHADLTTLPLDELRRELRECRDEIEHRLNRTPVSFAPPYGRANRREREEVRRCFQLSLGTTLARARRSSDPYDIPRIEMHYFHNLKRWREYLEGDAEGYLGARRALRRIKHLVPSLTGLWESNGL